MHAIGTKLVIQADLSEEKSEGGIIMTQQVQLPQGTVIDVGPKVEDKRLVPGAKVLFVGHAVTQIEVNKKPFFVLDEMDILVVLE